MFKFLLLFALTTTPAIAGERNLRSTDMLLSQERLDNIVRGHVLVYYDGGTSDFRTDGQYFYTYGGGGTWEGQYEIRTDSTICVTYVTGQQRCDLYVINNSRIIVITDDGTRFPIKNVTPN